jgi:phosphatidylserine/phosphatidylglycerophosphate/cardiolipin synthase-like enzyme
MNVDCEELRRLASLLGSDNETIARLAAALWARVGRPVNYDDLQWAKSLGGEAVPKLLEEAIVAFGAAVGSPPRLTASGVSTFVAMLLGNASSGADLEQAVTSKVLWTLPPRHSTSSVRGAGIRDALRDLVRSAKQRLLFVTPYIESFGIGELLAPLVEALGRGVEVRILTNDALNLSSPCSRALEVLRQEADRLRSDLTVFSGECVQGSDRMVHPLLHAKLFIADSESVLIGSANLTAPALSSNFEAAVILGPPAAEECLAMVESIIQENLAYLAFSTKGH